MWSIPKFIKMFGKEQDSSIEKPRDFQDSRVAPSFQSQETNNNPAPKTAPSSASQQEPSEKPAANKGNNGEGNILQTLSLSDINQLHIQSDNECRRIVADLHQIQQDKLLLIEEYAEAKSNNAHETMQFLANQYLTLKTKADHYAVRHVTATKKLQMILELENIKSNIDAERNNAFPTDLSKLSKEMEVYIANAETNMDILNNLLEATSNSAARALQKRDSQVKDSIQELDALIAQRSATGIEAIDDAVNQIESELAEVRAKSPLKKNDKALS